MGLERAAVVGFGLKGGSLREIQSSLDELTQLLETAGGRAISSLIQQRDERDPGTLIGHGKVEELARLVRQEKLQTIVFDNELTPAQQKNLQEKIQAKILDRTRLILDIFARRAHTKEGKLQVELAQLSYLLPRITERFGRFEQQVGGIGTRGPGERKLEVDQRHIRDRIARIRRDIANIRLHRQLQRQHRQRVPLPMIALIGYTNVGKSTLLNALTKGRPVYADDKLFATLDPTARRVILPGGRTTLFVDTVGFIQKLPHQLVAAFHATLEEVADADLLIHLVDPTHPQWTQTMTVVNDVLKELQADRLPRLKVFSKCDLLTKTQQNALRREGGMMISSQSKEGLPALLDRVESLLRERLLVKDFYLPYNRHDVLAHVYETGQVLSKRTLARGLRLRILIDPKNWGQIEKKISQHDTGQ
ncbi:MAG TPA: GTPase HflX [Elusimicrobiota bacterium]|nr:GTPase HflX [Elusimicrobiota bacterium]